LACYEGLVIVDKEEQMVRLMHHSFRQFLLRGFRDPTNKKFTIALVHRRTANIIITYLNYGVFDTQLSTTITPCMKIGLTPSQIIQSTIDPSTSQNIALKLLKSRKKPSVDIGKVVANAISHYSLPLVDIFHFYVYAKSYCMQHVLYASKQVPVLLSY
jgi:ankyrin repeat domain-containing protein 50